MKIIVAVKRVIDAYVKPRVKADNSGVETQNVKMSMNPFDEIAVEEAIRIKEKNPGSEIILVSIGNETCQETLRHGLALGGDRAILIKTNKALCSLNIAKILKSITEQENPSLILLGKQAIDGDNNQTAQMLAALLDWPQATFVSALTINENKVEATREVDGGLETLGLSLPAVISTDLRLNEPRYASLPNIMKSKTKPLQIVELESMNLNLSEHIEVLSVKAPALREGGIKVDSVASLIAKLKQEAKVI